MSITRGQLEMLVRQLCEAKPDTRVIGIHAEDRGGHESVDTDGATFRVAWCGSPLALSAQLAALDDGERLVVLTPLTDADLGADVLARLARRRLIHPERWQMVCHAYGVTAVDPRLPRQSWMAEALLAAAPAASMLRAHVLSEDAAWLAVLDHHLALSDGRPDADDIVVWSTRQDAATRFASLADPLAEAIVQRLENTAGAVGVLFACAIKAGHAADLLPVGLACDVLFRENDATPDAELMQGAVRLEPLLGGVGIDPSLGLAWAACARRVLRATPKEQRDGWLDSGERLLVQIKVERWAGRSVILPSGFSRRLDRFAQAADAAIGDVQALVAAEYEYDRMREHDACAEAPERAERLTMAMRLLRSLHCDTADLTGLAPMMRYHVCDGAFEDWARRRLREGDQHVGVAALYAALRGAVRDRREQRNRAFALQVRSWTRAPHDPEVVAIEDCLTAAVVPAAKSRPVLVLVLDAMDAGIFEELARNLSEQSWRRWRTTPAAALAVVPTVTEVSRTALFSGQVTRGGGAGEKRAFAEHPALREVSQRGRPPLLFHKADIMDELGVASEVRAALADQRQRVVGIVLNAVDDHLAKSEQLQLSWRTDLLTPLHAILHGAHAAGRLVVLTSDHGHVLEAGSIKVHGNVEARWRTAERPAGDLEIELDGERVRAATGRERVIVPWSETIRYGYKKNGYHGGLTVQEAVVPIGLFTPPGEQATDMQPMPHTPPSWWEAAGPAPEEAEPSPQSPVSESVGPAGQLDLFRGT